MKRPLILSLTLSLLAVVGLSRSALAADNTDNDRILRGDRKEYIEVFKKDSSGGDKNYLYTISEFTDAHGRVCTVVSGDSEKTIALDCEFKRG